MVIGIDNGVTGSIGIINGSFLDQIQTPVFQPRTMGKEGVFHYSWLNHDVFKGILLDHIDHADLFNGKLIVYMERPMISPGPRFHGSISASLCFASQYAILHDLKNYTRVRHVIVRIIDSKEWQSWIKKNFKKEIGRTRDLKQMSTKVASLFVDNPLPDGDGFCIAMYAADKEGQVTLEHLKATTWHRDRRSNAKKTTSKQ